MTYNCFAPPSRKEIKNLAKSMLTQRRVLLMLIFSLALCCIIFFAVELAEALAYYVLTLAFPALSASLLFDTVLTLIFDAGSILLMAPVVIGTFRLASFLAAGKDPDMTEVLYYFSRRRYARSLAAFSVIAIPITLYSYLLSAISMLTEYIGGSVYSTTYEAFLQELTFFGIYFIVAAATFALFVPYCRLFSAIAAIVNGEDQPIALCIRASLSATKGKIGAILSYSLSFIPLCLLSLLTFGMLFVIFTAPYMLISYFYYNAVLFGKDPVPARKTEVTFDER